LKNPRTSRRIAAAATVAVCCVTAFAALGGVGLAQSAPSDGQYGKKVTICHKGKKTITISKNAWPAHKRHGDTLGTCQSAAAKAKAAKLKAAKVKAAKIKAAKAKAAKVKAEKVKGEKSKGEKPGKGGGKGKGKGKGK
jgi:hypothetical protein